MSLYANLRLNASPSPVPAVKGHWFNIRFTPDLTDGETLNIGVGFVAEDRQIHAKLLTDFTCLQCLYGDRLDLDELQFLMGATCRARALRVHIIFRVDVDGLAIARA